MILTNQYHAFHEPLKMACYRSTHGNEHQTHCLSSAVGDSRNNKESHLGYRVVRLDMQTPSYNGFLSLNTFSLIFS